MSLYQLAKEYQALYEQIDEIPEDAFADTLEGIQGEFNEKADNIACFIKSLKADADGIKAEATALKEREASKRAKADRLRAYLLEQMQAIGTRKIESPRNVISLAKPRQKWLWMMILQRGRKLMAGMICLHTSNRSQTNPRSKKQSSQAQKFHLPISKRADKACGSDRRLLWGNPLSYMANPAAGKAGH